MPRDGSPARLPPLPTGDRSIMLRASTLSSDEGGFTPMTPRYATPMPERGLLSITGADRITFLNGVTSNDVRRVDGSRALWSAFLTPQGKYLHDFFIVAIGERLLLETEAERLDDLARRMRVYKLRSAVTIEPATAEFAVFALTGTAAFEAVGLAGAEPGQAVAWGGGVVFIDPRLPDLGLRAILPRDTADATLAAAGFETGKREAYERQRIMAGVPDGSRDIEIEKSLLLECGFDELHGVDWDKGCFLGQELTARSKYRLLIKKRLLPVAVNGPLPAPGTPIMLDGREVGEVRSGVADCALALLRLESADEAGLVAGGATLSVMRPAWFSAAASPTTGGTA